MVVAFTVISCSSSIVYKNAQPSGGRMIKKIPNRHLGKYIDDKDTLTLLKTAFILDGEKLNWKMIVYYSNDLKKTMYCPYWKIPSEDGMCF